MKLDKATYIDDVFAIDPLAGIPLMRQQCQVYKINLQRT
jgi:hypothetical protein